MQTLRTPGDNFIKTPFSPQNQEGSRCDSHSTGRDTDGRDTDLLRFQSACLAILKQYIHIGVLPL